VAVAHLEPQLFLGPNIIRRFEMDPFDPPDRLDRKKGKKKFVALLQTEPSGLLSLPGVGKISSR